MSSIRTAIELQDNFTSILYQVISSVNLGISAMDDLHQTMDSPVDTTSLYAARDAINGATAAIQEMVASFQETDTQIEIPPPVWQSDPSQIFAGTGVERFEQEVTAASRRLEQLCDTQDVIAKQAYGTNIFSPQAFRDLNGLAVRMDMLRSRIEQIESHPLNIGTDAANNGLEQMRGNLDQAVQAQNDLSYAAEHMDVQAANEAYLRLSQTVAQTERYIRDNVDEQGRFNQAIRQGEDDADGLMQTIKGAVAAYATIQTLKGGLDLSDQMANTTARLNLMNDGLQSTQELQGMIFASAERSRGAYQATADAVSKLGLMAGDAFESSGEIVAFMEQINKQFRIAGTETAGIEAAMLQLTQAMGSGVLRGEEYNSILEQAPNIIQATADYMEVPKGQLKDMAADGAITADIVKAAMFAAADDTNAKFAEMPMTFGQIWTSFENYALMAFQPVLTQMNEIGNSESFQVFVTGAIDGLSMVAGIALEIFDLMAGIAGAVSDNWSWLSPIIYGVASALAVYYGAQFAANAISTMSNGIHIAMAAAQMLHATATGTLTAATAAEIAAQNGLNAAMYASPIAWIIILIIALVALFYAAVAAVNKFAGTSVSATGIICGVFMVAAALIGNLFIASVNFAIDIFVVLWNFIAAFANFFANVFNDPVGSVARLFFDLVDTVLGLLETLASAIDTIFGSDLAGAVSGWRDSLSGWVDDTFGKGDEVMQTVNAEDWKFNRFSYKDAANAGYDFGKGIDDAIADFGSFSLPDTTNTGNYPVDPGNYGQGIEDIGGGVGGIAKDTDAIKDSMEITKEDLKYLRDIAEQEYINRFTTAEIKVDMTNYNDVSSDVDLDGMVDHLKTKLEEEMASAAEGVHK